MRRQSANLNPLRQLDLETVQPLIDVAQWSTFEEVKRDAAAALATLCRDGRCFLTEEYPVSSYQRV